MEIIKYSFLLYLLVLGVIAFYSNKNINLIGYKRFRYTTYFLALFIILFEFGIVHTDVTTISYIITVPLALAINFVVGTLACRSINMSTKVLKIVAITETVMYSIFVLLHFAGVIDLDIYIYKGEYYSSVFFVETFLMGAAIFNAAFLLVVMYFHKNKRHWKYIYGTYIIMMILYVVVPSVNMSEFLLVAYFLTYLLLFSFGNDQGIDYEDNSNLILTLDIGYCVLNDFGIIVKIDGSNKTVHNAMKVYARANYNKIFEKLVATKKLLEVEDNIYKTNYGYIEKFEKFISKTQKIVYFRNITDEFVSNYDIRELSYTDFITGLSNRKALYRDVESLDLLKKNIIFIDMNKLKYINDTFGHKHGDRALIHISKSLKEYFKTSRVYRLGGDEFLVITKDDSERIKDFEVRNFYIEEKKLELSCSIGFITCKKYPGLTIHEYISHADKAMYYAKRNGFKFVGYCEIENNIE